MKEEGKDRYLVHRKEGRNNNSFKESRYRNAERERERERKRPI